MKKTSGRTLRRSAALLLAFLLLAASMPLTVFAAESPAVTTEYVHLRSGASSSTASKGVIPQETELTVTDTGNATWYAVRLKDGTTGYICSMYLRLSEPQEETPGSTRTAKTTAYLRVRAGRGTSYEILGLIPEGDTVTVTDNGQNGWYAVRLSDGTTGYVSGEYLVFLSSGTAAPSPTAKPTAQPTEKPDSGDLGTAVATTYVNMRAGRGTNYAILTLLATGTTVTITDMSDPTWYGVRLANGTTGYVCSDYLKVTSSSTAKPTASPTARPENDLGTAVTTTYVNMRAGRGTNYAILTLLATGTKVAVTDMSDPTWYGVRLANGTTGYVCSDYLDVTLAPSAQPTASPTAAPTASPTPTVSPTPTPTASPSPTASPTAKPSDSPERKAVATAYVNLRSGRGTQYKIICLVDLGDTVTVTDMSDSGWYGVRLSDGTTGYISSEYLELQDPAATPDPSDGDTVTGKTNADLCLRAGPGTSFNIIRVLADGEKLTLVAVQNNAWYKVRTARNEEGWVSAQYVEILSGNVSSLSSGDEGTTILDVPCLAQEPEFPNGCEPVSAAMLCGYYGIPFDTGMFVDNYLPMAPIPYQEYGVMFGGDMRKAFLGNPRSTTGWGIYATGIAPAMNTYISGSGHSAEVLSGVSLEDLLHQTVDTGNPAMIWVTIGMQRATATARWTVRETGESLQWIYPMHCTVLSGYSDNGNIIYLNDPLTGHMTPYSRSAVEAAYNALGQQAIILT